MIERTLIAIAMFTVCFSAYALNAADIGVYAIVHVDGHVTQKEFRVSRSEKGWAVENHRPDGSWEDITCGPECAMVESGPADVQRFLGRKQLKDMSAECIHDNAFAFCRVNKKSTPAQPDYLFIALTEQKPITLRLVRLPPEKNTWKDQQGNSIPNTESRNSVDGFAGFVVVTSDPDWREKWDTPSDTAPKFTEAKVVAIGKTVYVLTFFSSPQLTGNGKADITCDIDVVRPDGSSSMHQADAVCFQGEIKGSPYSLYLSAPVIGFIGEPNDPLGTWLVRVTLKDNIRHVVLPLKTSFTLQ